MILYFNYESHGILRLLIYFVYYCQNYHEVDLGHSDKSEIET